MEPTKYHLDKSVKTFYIMANSFPQGIQTAFDKLHSLLPATTGRTFYGISRPNRQGVIEYRAAVAEAFDGEAEKYGCDTLTIPAGNYLTTTITNWQQNIPQIQKAFDELLKSPQLQPDTYCYECYKNDTELLCMVKITT